MQITARLNEYRQSPRKVRLVANFIKGKKIADAKDVLAFLVKRSASPISKLIDSAVANAENNFNIKSEDLFIKNLRVDEGVTLKRRRPRARGMAFAINKRTSRVLVELDTLDNMPGHAQKAEKAEKTKVSKSKGKK
jgi:large subunit ribosomal protein L22